MANTDSAFCKYVSFVLHVCFFGIKICHWVELHNTGCKCIHEQCSTCTCTVGSEVSHDDLAKIPLDCVINYY